MAQIKRKMIIRIEIAHSDAKALQDVCEKRGMTQISLVSRMVKWLARQESEVQVDILNTDPEDWSKDKNLKLLKRLSAKSK